MGLPAAYGGGAVSDSQVASHVTAMFPPLTIAATAHGTSEQDLCGYQVGAADFYGGAIVEMVAFLSVTSVATPPKITVKGYYGAQAITIASAVQIAVNLSAALLRVTLRLQDLGGGSQFLDGIMEGHIATVVTANPPDEYQGFSQITNDDALSPNFKLTIQYDADISTTAITVVSKSLVRLA